MRSYDGWLTEKNEINVDSSPPGQVFAYGTLEWPRSLVTTENTGNGVGCNCKRGDVLLMRRQVSHKCPLNNDFNSSKLVPLTRTLVFSLI